MRVWVQGDLDETSHAWAGFKKWVKSDGSGDTKIGSTVCDCD